MGGEPIKPPDDKQLEKKESSAEMDSAKAKLPEQKVGEKNIEEKVGEKKAGEKIAEKKIGEGTAQDTKTQEESGEKKAGEKLVGPSSLKKVRVIIRIAETTCSKEKLHRKRLEIPKLPKSPSLLLLQRKNPPDPRAQIKHNLKSRNLCNLRTKHRNQNCRNLPKLPSS
eukprot:Gregarina_sp_Poly_1__7397@NODE_4097_length_731_cov_5_841867_g2680_i0_p1_GENE_NODE_4097_length_731_cov_5_841867_g2680_i0NODE_4097_length_731_cov_5_841867_g2680_i0_p1_ORF_typecomplete_len178_score29_87_NODE_4097_length_731_cov_5_841867_g2680_i0196699